LPTKCLGLFMSEIIIFLRGCIKYETIILGFVRNFKEIKVLKNISRGN